MLAGYGVFECVQIHEFEHEMKTYNLGSFTRLPSAKLYSDKATASDATHDVRQDTEWVIAKQDDDESATEQIVMVCATSKHGAEKYSGDLACMFYEIITCVW